MATRRLETTYGLRTDKNHALSRPLVVVGFRWAL
jgi:hypothetical protein